MRFTGVMIASAGLLSACATDPAGPGGLPTSADNGNECAIIAAVLREHYRFNTTDNPAPTLWLAGDGWRPHCDWGRHRVALGDVRYGSPEATNMNWVSVHQPRYDNEGALVHSGQRSGARVGEGVECRVRSGFAGWTVTECKTTSIK